MDLVQLLQMQDPRGVRAFRTNITRKTRVSARDKAWCVELHESLLHILPYETMAATIESGAWGNVHPSITPQLCRAIAKRRDCAICALTWNTPRAVGTGTAVEEIGAYFAFDNEGKMKTPSMGCHFSSTFMDLGCGFTKVYGLKKKTAIIDAIRAWVIEMLSYKRIPRGGRCDAGSVETGKEFQEAMGVLGLDVIPNPSKEPEHSVERKWQTTHNGTVKVLATVDAFTTADWLTSQTTSSNVNNTVPNARSRRHDPSKSPLELMTGRKVDMTMIQTLQVGDVCVVAHKKGRAMGRPRNVLARVMDVDLDGGRCALLKYMDDSQRVERKAGMMPVADIETGPIASRLRSRTVTMAPDEHGELIISIAGRTDSADTLRSLTLRQQQERQEDEAREDTLIERIQGAQQGGEQSLECELSKRWKMVHEDAHDVLGVTIVTSEDGTGTMRQGPQLRKIQQHFYPKGEGPMVLAPGRRESTTVRPEGSTYKVTDREEYMKGLGILGYIRITRPDVRAALSIRGETMQYPTEQDDRELRWIAAYVLTTADVGITFHPGPKGMKSSANTHSCENIDTTSPIPISGSSDAS